MTIKSDDTDSVATQPSPIARFTTSDSISSELGPAINRDELLQRCLGNLALAERLMRRFEGELPANIDRLKELSANGDAKQFSALAHQLKGAAGNIAASGLLEHFTALEELGSQGRHLEAHESLRSLGEEYVRFQLEVRSLLDRS